MDLFERYVSTVFERFKGKVKYWLTFNEQNLIINEPKLWGVTVGEDEDREAVIYQLCHNIFVAHGKAVKALHKICPEAKMGGMVAYNTLYPYSCKPEDVLAAQEAKELADDLFFDVFVNGEYPTYFTKRLENKGITLKTEAGDFELLKENTVDYLSISYYQSMTVKYSPEDKNIIKGITPNPKLNSNEWGWAIDPIGLRVALKDMYSRYRMPIFVTENGIGVREELNENKTVEDDYRIDYLKHHIEQMKLAMEEGVEVIGYLTWGATDLLSSQGEMKN